MGERSYWDLFEWLMDLIFETLRDAVYSLGSDEEGNFLWGIEPVGDDELICYVCMTYQAFPYGLHPDRSVEILEALLFAVVAASF